jgi:dienelactone hydrolase
MPISFQRSGLFLPVLAICLFLPTPRLTSAQTTHSQSRPATTRPGTPRGERMVNDYFRRETDDLSDKCLAGVKTLQDWTTRRDEYRRQLAEMLGLWPEPQRTDLKATITGKVDSADFTVENLYFQSRPGLYVTANLYIPKNLVGPAPAVLYVCGHGNEKRDGISYGSKVKYQYFPAWLARNGYVSLVLDTLELGEIEGIHHGTYYEGMWWWHSRGYTPAGVEAWNGIRAIDYLCSRPEVDPNRIGITGRSGGGATSWWVAALDERVKAAVPTAGITDLHNHIIDGTIEGHCDCMFMVNTYRWDFPQVAALVAPRALLIANSDKDTIFPLDGVSRLHAKVRDIYRLYGSPEKLGLLITEGPHEDTQDLQVPTLRWLNRFLKGDRGQVTNQVQAFFEPRQLKVFDTLPADQLNTKIQESFVAKAPPPAVPADAEAWAKQRDEWMSGLKSQVFAGWPADPPPLEVKPAFSAVRDGVRLSAWDFVSQHDVPLRLYLARKDDEKRPDLIVLNVLDESGWDDWLASVRTRFADELKDEADSSPAAADETGWAALAGMLKSNPWAFAYVAPRGIGPTAWAANYGKKYDKAGKRDTQVRRRFALLGQTVDGMRVWDVRRAVQALRSIDSEPSLKGVPLWLQAERRMAGVSLYASLFEPDIARLDLYELSPTHDVGSAGPDLLNVLKVLDMPAAVALAAERSRVRVYVNDDSGKVAWAYPSAVAKALNWPERRIAIEKLTASSSQP